MKLINCKQIATEIEDRIAEQIYTLCTDPQASQIKRRPTLAIIKVGQRADSDLYVKIKERQARSVGIETSLYLLPEKTDETELLSVIKFLDQDDTVDGILVQLPLPSGLNTDLIIEQINPNKDVDGFHPENLARLTDSEDANRIIPPVYAGVLACLKQISFNLDAKSVLIIGKSDIFTRNLDLMLESLGAQVQVFKADEPWQAVSPKADLIISAVGQAKLIGASQVKDGVVLIDVGVSQIDGKSYGDVDAQSLEQSEGYLTPVPGGIGPLTVALALRNTLDNYLKNLENNE
jgi:methylenetetrahydrofolate dehydrogenase (NADP+)/methenyltetrahydrofolate cyclohydrolase